MTRSPTALRAMAAGAAMVTVAAVAAVAAGAAPAAEAREGLAIDWRPLQAGVEYAAIGAPAAGSGDGGASGIGGDGTLHIVRVDPARAPIAAVMASADDGRKRTAREWCRARRLAVAINMGMYRDDHRTNVGYARTGRHVNNGRWTRTYRSALGLGATRPGMAPAVMLDLEAPGPTAELADYETVVQNLRLISAPGRGMWGAQTRRWSEAAVAIDRRGRVLFVFSRRAYSMQEFNRRLLALPLEISAAMHVEGGPEASLSIHAGDVDLDLGGSYETGFNENDDERAQWPLPNVLGVPRRPGGG